MIKLHRILASALASAVSLFVVSCSNPELVVDTPSASVSRNTNSDIRFQLVAKVGVDEAENILSPNYIRTKGESVQATVEYAAEICNGTVEGTSTRNAINDPAAWSYYKFYGTAGDVITITVNRTGCGIDPAFSLFKGVTTSTDGLSVNSGNSDMEWIAWQDDDFTSLLGCGCQFDPTLVDYEIEESGWYTIAVYDFRGCGDDITFELEVSGLTCDEPDGGSTDTDGDGVADDADPFPDSDDQATIVIDGRDTDVENEYLSDGAYMMDKILYVRDNTNKHGKFVAGVTLLACKWKKAGLITNKERVKIIWAAAKSSW